MFLAAWPTGAALAIVGVCVLIGSPKDALRTWLRHTGVLLGVAVPLAAVAWWFVVVADGVKECGF
jgi:4-amino-4-deoxy-L-arabinose transferase-like glycosyltransferase